MASPATSPNPTGTPPGPVSPNGRAPTAATAGAVSAYDAVADVYDMWSAGMPDTAPAVEFLAARAAGRVLELGSGTGRVLLPLARRGLDVTGVEGSPRMVDRMRLRREAESVHVIVGDMADVPVAGPFGLVYSIYNSLFCLLDLDRQLHTFRTVAARLEPGGAFVVETGVPDRGRPGSRGRLAVSGVEDDRVLIEASSHDRALQRVDTQITMISDQGIRLFPSRLRYTWPSEFDLMAQLAGLHLEERFGGWRGEPYTASSPTHVSVYRVDRTGHPEER